MRNQIINLIYGCVDEFNDQAEAKDQLTKTEETVIFGKESSLDSLGLVNFIVSLEQTINDSFDREITLADERAMSQTDSPFKTVATLADYILTLIEEQK